MTQTSELGPTKSERARVPKWAVALLVLAALLGILSVAGTYVFLLEYGPTTGSWVDGGVAGLSFAAVPLVMVAFLAAVAFFLGRRTTWVIRGLALAVVLVSVGGVFVAGGQAVLGKYDRLAKVPYCGSPSELASMAGARAAEAEFARLEHPAPFGGGWSGVDGCGANVLNVTLAEATAHYREQLPTAGWSITRDDSTGLAARKGDLTFGVLVRCGLVEVEIRLAGTTNPIRC